MDCVVTPLKTLMGFSVHLNVQLKFYNLPYFRISLFDLAIVAPRTTSGATSTTGNSLNIEKRILYREKQRH